MTTRAAGLALLMLLALAANGAAQVSDMARFRASLGIGYGRTYSQALADYLQVPEAELGGLSINVRALARTGMLGSRVSLGGEYGIFTVHDRPVLSGDDCYPPGTICSEPEDLGHHLGAVAQLDMMALPRLTLEAGAGVVFYVLPGGFADIGSEEPGAELMSDVKLIASLPLGAWSVDAYIAGLRTFGRTAATHGSAGLGVSFLWGAFGVSSTPGRSDP